MNNDQYIAQTLKEIGEADKRRPYIDKTDMYDLKYIVGQVVFWAKQLQPGPWVPGKVVPYITTLAHYIYWKELEACALKKQKLT